MADAPNHGNRAARAEAIGLIVIVAAILLAVLVRWRGIVHWSAR